MSVLVLLVDDSEAVVRELCSLIVFKPWMACVWGGDERR